MVASGGGVGGCFYWNSQIIKIGEERIFVQKNNMVFRFNLRA